MPLKHQTTLNKTMAKRLKARIIIVRNGKELWEYQTVVTNTWGRMKKINLYKEFRKKTCLQKKLKISTEYLSVNKYVAQSKMES